jgi:hypothetical protein
MSLGVVLTPFGQIPGAPPWEVGYSYGGNGTYLCPDDPQYNQRGEPGLYYDTRLGGAKRSNWLTRRIDRKVRKKLAGLGHSIPTDFDLAPTYGYVPVTDGFVAAKEGFQPGTWIPPNGWNPAGAYGPQMVTPGLGGIGATVDSSEISTLVATLRTATPLFYLSLPRQRQS